jgi:hypothetical protein
LGFAWTVGSRVKFKHGILFGVSGAWENILGCRGKRHKEVANSSLPCVFLLGRLQRGALKSFKVTGVQGRSDAQR